MLSDSGGEESNVIDAFLDQDKSASGNADRDATDADFSGYLCLI